MGGTDINHMVAISDHHDSSGLYKIGAKYNYLIFIFDRVNWIIQYLVKNRAPLSGIADQ